MTIKVTRSLVIFLLATLIAIRIALPYFLLSYVKNEINKIPEYRAEIADIDINLWQGSYTIKDLQLWKMKGNIPVPFVAAKSMRFLVDWSALLHAKLVAQIKIDYPTLNFVTDPTGKNEQLTISQQWLEVIKKLYPLNINKTEIYNGQLFFRSYNSSPPFSIYIKNVTIAIENLQVVTSESSSLPSTFSFKGNPLGGGNVNLSGRFNPFNKQPTFYLQGKLVGLNIPQIKNVLKSYTAVDVSRGTFSLYAELAAAKGRVSGYAKPFIKNLKIGENKQNAVSGLMNGVATVVAKILENPKKKTIATKINISGQIDDPNTNILSIILYALQHAFIQSLLPQIDQSVKMQDVTIGKKSIK